MADTDSPVTDGLSTTGAAAIDHRPNRGGVTGPVHGHELHRLRRRCLGHRERTGVRNHSPDVPIRYDRDATPDVASEATSDTVTGSSPSRFAAISGASVSILTSMDLVASTLPAMSVERNCTDCAPSTSMVTGAV